MPKTLPQFLWHYVKRYKLNIAGLIFVALYWACHISLSPYAMKLIIDRVSTAGSNTENLFEVVRFPAILYVSLGLLLGLVFRFYDWMILRTFPKMKSEITVEMFDYVEGHSYSYFQNNFAGSLANKINDMAKGSALIIINLIELFLARTIGLLLGATTMFLVRPAFCAVLVIWGIIFITVSILLSKKAQIYSAQFSESRSTVVGRIVDSIANILNVKSFARNRFETKHLQKSTEESMRNDLALQWYLLKVKAFYAVSITIFIACMTWLLIYERAKNAITIGDFALILTLSMILIEEVWYVANQFVTFSEDLGTCQQALSIISIKPEIIDESNTQPLQVSRGEIVFDKVHFNYGKGNNIFTDKSITIRSGERVGLVGFSGSGKSTFINLILRFFDVTSGRIMIDGQNIKNVTQDSLRSQIGMIPQDPLLFHRSLLDNIRYGRLEATEEEVIAASKKAHCHEFIEKLHSGYHTLAGERGVKLSGGQKQRVAIARAILKDAPILILDEATSSLDSIIESYIQESLNLLMQHKTTLVIAHRLSTLFNMQRILVFSEGEIIEDGSHRDLLRQNGHYAMLWNMQSGGFIGDSQLEGKEG